MGHGGVNALGVNNCVMTLPALTAGCLFHLLYRHRLSAVLVAISTVLGLLGVAAGLHLLITTPASTVDWLIDPLTLALLGATGILITCISRYWPVAPEFALGLFIGEFAVLMTLALQSLVLVFGGVSNWEKLAITLFLIHLPVAVVEGIILGFTVAFLARVKPQLLRSPIPALPPGEAACSAAPTP
jgi:ABC-type Co2+ transport system permease subunit